jgi:two-component system LytT family response regulator
MAKVLRDYQSLLEPFGFIRTHASHLINKQHVSSIDINGDIIMNDQSKAGISRRKRREVFSELRFTRPFLPES